ncbi:DUF3281 family protein [Francisella hispaniensis]|nr:DUF3281 family protein [Francisella hispaniensis]
MITKRKFLIRVAIILLSILLGGCGKTETTNELRIVYQCNTVDNTLMEFNDDSALCRFELVSAQVSRYTNVLGRTIERVQSQTPVRDSQGSITWILPQDATEADNADVVYKFGSGCQDDNCTINANPTAYKIPVGNNVIRVSGIVNVNSKTVDLSTAVPAAVIDVLYMNCSVCLKNHWGCWCEDDDANTDIGNAEEEGGDV